MATQPTYTVTFEPSGSSIRLTGLGIEKGDIIKIDNNTFPNDYAGTQPLTEIMKPFVNLAGGGGKRRKKKTKRAKRFRTKKQTFKKKSLI